MSKFFVNAQQIDTESKNICIVGEDVNHMKNVLRASVGSQVTLCDGEGFDYLGTITQIEKNKILVSYEDKIACDTEPQYAITLYQGVAKGERMDQLIQKCVELGITRIVPVLCNRTVVKFHSEKDAVSKVERWQKIAGEAAKQCNRGVIPEVCMPVGFSEAIAQAKDTPIKLIPYEEEKENTIKQFISSLEKPDETAYFIGPEGGFAPEEVALACDNGFTPITLGKRILRTETAGPAVLAIFRCFFED